jgi:ubiquinone/menaquinone biosynthesis C-methylase UbiE/lipopolysaccharide biosynthesis glycosyltransferase
MVSKDVSDEARRLLRCEFDVVVEVPIICGGYVRTSGVFDSKYSSWIREAYTKWNALGLVQYKRVVFFDADCLILGDVSCALMDPDHQDRAAGVFSNPWSHTVMALTPERIDPDKSPMVDEYTSHISTADHDRLVNNQQVIPSSAIRLALDGPLDFSVCTDVKKDRWSGMRFVCAGSSIMFQPFVGGVQLFEQHLERLSRPNPRCGGSGPDDQSIVRFLLEYHPIHAHKGWQLLHAGWCFIPWKQALLKSQGLGLEHGMVQHYFNLKKPWESLRSDWPDLETWWAVHDRLTTEEKLDPTHTSSPTSSSSSSSSSWSRVQLLMTRTPQLMSQLLKTQLRRYPKLHTQLCEKLTTLVPLDHPQTHEFDDVVYTTLREFYHGKLLTQTTPAARAKALESMEVGASEGRADWRAQQVVAFLPTTDLKGVVLDLGCGNGTITERLLEYVNLSCVGVDLPEVIKERCHPKVAYRSSAEGQPLPLKDNEASVVVALMSLHHMRDLDLKLKEVARVLEPGGTLVIREHDAPDGDQCFAALLDVMHGLYARVWPAIPECQSFVGQYYGRYMSRVQWRAKLQELGGWTRVDGSTGLDGGGLGRFYYDVWQRE